MKTILLTLLASLALVAVNVSAQTYSVTSNSTSYAPGGGQITFNVAMSYPAGAVPSIYAKPPSATWAYASEAGANVPSVKPNATDTTDPADASSVFGFSYISPPAGDVAFSFVLSYPAGLTGNQVIALAGDYRLNGVRTPVTLAAITLVPEGNQAPSISSHPQGGSYSVGQSVTLTVVASGTPPLSYQWKKGDADISGANSAAYTIPSLVLGDAGAYSVRVSNSLSNVTSNAANLTVTSSVVAPSITTQPQSQSVGVGGVVSFAVVATGTAPLAYQWRKDTVNIPGATGASYTIFSTVSSDAGSYTVVVSNSGGANPVTSSAAVLTVTPPSPANYAVTTTATSFAPGGGQITFNVTLNYPANSVPSLGVKPPTSAWAYVSDAGANGPTIKPSPGDTTDPADGSSTFGFSYITPPVSPATFSFVLSYPAGLTGSQTIAFAANYRLGGTLTPVSVASITIGAASAPTITTQPVAVNTLIRGATATFSVVATGNPAPTYLWKKGTTNLVDGGNVSGATTDTLTLTNIQAADSADYMVVVTNTQGFINSQPANLTVIVPPTITTPPQSQSVVGGAAVNLTVVVSSQGTPTYQWKKGGVAIDGATLPFYNIPSVQIGDAGSYTVEVTNAAGTTPSTAAVLTVTSSQVAPAITTQPVSQSKSPGQSVTFTVAASGNPAPTYQWRKDSNAISGATAASYTIASVAVGDAGSYTAVASNGVGTPATSNAATLTVLLVPVITSQPAAQVVVVGGTATFAVGATNPGSGSLTYRWYFTPAGSSTPQQLSDLTGKRAGTQTATLTLSDVQAGDAGDYVCTVTNTAGDTTSAAAPLSTTAARTVRIVSQTAAPGATVVVPVELVASGAENTVSFSLDFDATKLAYSTSALGTGAAGASMTRNVTQASSGKITFLIGMEPGTVFTAGTKTILNITFTVNASAADGAVLALAFSDSPTSRRIIDVNSATLPGPFVDGNVSVSAGLEGDVNNDGQVDAADWVKLGRYVVGLDPLPTGTIFRRADAAPRADKGDAVVDAADWVQLGRFVVGLDVPQPTGGPFGPIQ